jgi:hypothetical protein
MSHPLAQSRLVRVSAARWALLTLVTVLGSAAITGVFRWFARGLSWPAAAAVLLLTVLVMLALFWRLLRPLPMRVDRPVRAEPVTDEHLAGADRVEVVDPVGVQRALDAGLVPVLRGHHRVELDGGAIEVRDTARVVLHGAARAIARDGCRVEARDDARVSATDRATVVATGERVEVSAEGVAWVEMSAGSVRAHGRSVVRLAGDGHCRAAEEATVLLADGLVEAADDVRVLAEDGATGVVAARDRVVVRHHAGVRLVSASEDVHVLSPDEPGAFDHGAVTWFRDERIALDAVAWARAWRVPVVDGHVALAVGADVEGNHHDLPVAVQAVPELPERRERLLLPWVLLAAPPRDARALEGEDPGGVYLTVWVPLDAVDVVGPSRMVRVRAVVSSGAAWLDEHGLPASRHDRSGPPRTLGSVLAERFGPAGESLPALDVGVDDRLGHSGWTVKWLPAPLDTASIQERRPWWELVAAEDAPDGRALATDRLTHQIFVGGPRPAEPDAPLRAVVVAGVVGAVVLSVVGAELGGAASAAAWAAATALLAGGLVAHVAARRRHWLRRRWWWALARQHDLPADDSWPGRASYLFIMRETARMTRVPGPRRRRPAPALGAPGGWAWIGLVAGAVAVAVGVAAAVPSIAAGNAGSAAVAAGLGLAGCALAVVPWRARRDRRIDPEDPPEDLPAPPRRIAEGEHRLERGRYVLVGSPRVHATGSARLVIAPSSAARVSSTGYAHVEQRGGRAVVAGWASAVVRGGSADCRDDAVAHVWGGQVRVGGDALVVAHGGEVSAADPSRVVRVGDGDAPPRLPAGAALPRLLEEAAAQGLQPVARSAVASGGRRADVVCLDGRLDVAALTRFVALPPDARWDARQGRLWLPGEGVLLESAPPRAGGARRLAALLVPLAAVPVGAAALAARDAAAPPAGLFGWAALLALTVVAAIQVAAAPWLGRVRGRAAMVRGAAPSGPAAAGPPATPARSGQSPSGQSPSGSATT